MVYVVSLVLSPWEQREVKFRVDRCEQRIVILICTYTTYDSTVRQLR